jgi:hypothetical protein
MEQSKRKALANPFLQDELRDSCHKIQVPGQPFSVKFFHLRVIAKRLAIEGNMSSTEAIHRVAAMWEKVKLSMDLLQFYTTKWKRMKTGSLVSVRC